MTKKIYDYYGTQVYFTYNERYGNGNSMIVRMFFATYCNKGLKLYYADEEYGTITVNLIPCEKNCAFIDEKNYNIDGHNLHDWLIENKIAEPTGRIFKNRVRKYREMRFIDIA